MAKLQYPDHAGRMSGHPRYGNPSDPNEETARIEGASNNLEKWASKYGGEFSGGVSMQYGSSKRYEVGIGNPEIAQKVTSRPIETPKEPEVIEDLLTKERINKAYKDLKDSMDRQMYLGENPPKISLWTRIKRIFR